MIDDEILELNLEIDQIVRSIHIILDGTSDLRMSENEELKCQGIEYLKEIKDKLIEALESIVEFDENFREEDER